MPSSGGGETEGWRQRVNAPFVRPLARKHPSLLCTAGVCRPMWLTWWPPDSVAVKVALPKVRQVSAGGGVPDGLPRAVSGRATLALSVLQVGVLAVVVAVAVVAPLCAVGAPDDVLVAVGVLLDSKLGQCLVRIGCNVKQRLDVATFCSRRGYCKDGYCNFRAGDLTPRGDTRPEVFQLTSVETPGTPCIDNCCPTWTNCSQDSTMLAVRSPGRVYREEEVLLPPREGDPRLGVNQNYDRMPYSIPLANLP
ncbi:hypothetical protein PHYPSEUDO_010161 [Phytophthora pseudosyringae]|uniref:Uncharacterized protein n=1 Tax=Phytophthora pseudosyringae TaxID=221518 RepID=A0A8T1W875_9STRA|nr:hypothetical protein PHYPSEUDO_010161 [Phytophthora pseudosyringae]